MQTEFVVFDTDAEKVLFGFDNMLLYGIILCNDHLRFQNDERIFPLNPQKDIFAVAKISKDTKILESALQEINFGPSINDEGKNKFLTLFKTFPTVFAHGKNILGTMEGYEFDIQLNCDATNPKLKKKAYPTSPQRRIDIERNINE